MRRQDIQLLASARQGDTAARREVGRRYLSGTCGFPHHVQTGLEYLTHPSVAGSDETAKIIAETLPLHDLVRLGQVPALEAAARLGSASARVKLGLWILLSRRDGVAKAKGWFQQAAAMGDSTGQAAAAAVDCRPHPSLQNVMRAFAAHPSVDVGAVLTLAITSALRCDDPVLLSRTLDCMLALQPDVTPDLADSVCNVLVHAQGLSHFQVDAPGERIERLLENCIQRGRPEAALLLGRALCGIDHAALRAASLAAAQNMRKGAALLMRAADSGIVEAWMHLYRIHSDNHTSVSNPLMSRFYLEKAAIGGNVTAQRRLGALVLRSATSLYESEQGIRWLHEAAQQGDGHASRLLHSLVLQVQCGDQDAADDAIGAIQKDDPWMACRLHTARDFGLTKLEALSVDIVAGLRDWGLVVGPNPFIAQAKLSAARAIPALTRDIAERLRRSATFFEQGRHDGVMYEGDLRKRSIRLRQLLEQHHADESMFFVDVRSTTLQALRLGTKWAFRARQPLRVALAA